jgi:hypothetical protein
MLNIKFMAKIAMQILSKKFIPTKQKLFNKLMEHDVELNKTLPEDSKIPIFKTIDEYLNSVDFEDSELWGMLLSEWVKGRITDQNSFDTILKELEHKIYGK